MSRVAALEVARAYGSNGRFLHDLAKRVAIPTESQNATRIVDCYRYLAHFADDLELLGFDRQIIDNETPGGGPFLIARRIEDTALPTLLVYGHADVVLGMEGEWNNSRDPWTISVEGDRIFGRGTADNKGQHTIVALAIEAVLAVRQRLGYNLVLLLETSEETGSAGLYEFCEKHKDMLKADWLIASDGPRLVADRPTLVGGTRGTYDFDLICDLRAGGHHSGNWGGLIANPATILSNAIAALISEQGHIRVRDIVPAAIPSGVSEALRAIAIRENPEGPKLDPWWGEPDLTPAERVFGWTSLEVLAMTAGTPDHPVNAIPPKAWARMQIRYTVDVDPTRFHDAIREFLDGKGFDRIQMVSSSFEYDWGATRLDPEHPLMKWAVASIHRTTGERATVLPNAGGSLPNNCFADLLGIPTVWVPHSYSGCSQHAPDEHLLMPLVVEGLAIMTGLFWDLGTDDPPPRRGAHNGNP